MRRCISIAVCAALSVMQTNAIAFDNTSAEDGDSAQTYCVKSEKATLVLVDRTTKYDALDRRILDEGLSAVVEKSSSFDRIIIRTISDDPFHSDKIFDECKPGCEKAWWSLLTCNSFKIKMDADRFFHLAASSVHPIMADTEEHSRSEIFASIAILTREYRDAKIQRIVIFSDLLENSPEFSTASILYSKPESVLGKLNRAGLVAEAQGVDVTVCGIGRSDGPERKGLTYSQQRNLKSVWTAWFNAGRVKSVNLYQWCPDTH